MSRADRETPYRVEHSRSLIHKAAAPRNLLAWFLDGFRSEMPDEIHAAGVWREYVTEDGLHVGGGSALGAPRYADPFRRLLEDGPFGLEVAEYEGHKDLVSHYRTPMRAALARLAGRGRDTEPSPFMARVLYRTVLRDGDWNSACDSMGIVEPVRLVYIEEALRRLWSRYEVEPSNRGGCSVVLG